MTPNMSVFSGTWRGCQVVRLSNVHLGSSAFSFEVYSLRTLWLLYVLCRLDVVAMGRMCLVVYL